MEYVTVIFQMTTQEGQLLHQPVGSLWIRKLLLQQKHDIFAIYFRVMFALVSLFAQTQILSKSDLGGLLMQI